MIVCVVDGRLAVLDLGTWSINVCVSGGGCVGLDTVGVCGHVFVAEPAVFGVCADCSQLSPPSKYQCLCASCQASGSFCPWEHSAGQFRGAQPQLSHLPSETLNSNITAQLSPLVLSWQHWMPKKSHGSVFSCTRGKVMPQSILWSNVCRLSNLSHYALDVFWFNLTFFGLFLFYVTRKTATTIPWKHNCCSHHCM